MLAAGRKLTQTSIKLTSRTRSMIPCASSNPPGPISNGDTPAAAPSPAGALDFLLLASNLKTSKRTGWVLRNVQGPESIADHMYRMSLMSIIAGLPPGVDQNRVIKMSIVHDVAEAIVGDITPHCNVSREEKKQMEEDAIKQMEQMLGAGTAAASEVGTLWREYEAAQTPEAQHVKDFDKLEMIMQAYQYENAQPELNLQEFWDATENAIKTPLGKAWADELRARRKSKKQGNEGGGNKS